MAQGNGTAANGSNTSGLQSSHSDQESKTDPIMLLLFERKKTYNFKPKEQILLIMYQKNK